MDLSQTHNRMCRFADGVSPVPALLVIHSLRHDKGSPDRGKCGGHLFVSMSASLEPGGHSRIVVKAVEDRGDELLVVRKPGGCAQ